MAQVNKRMRIVAAEQVRPSTHFHVTSTHVPVSLLKTAQVVRDLAIQSSCSINVVLHALIIASGDVALARRYLTNREKVVDEMLLMTFEQDKWLIHHGARQQAAGDAAPAALVSDADAIKLQVCLHTRVWCVWLGAS